MEKITRLQSLIDEHQTLRSAIDALDEEQLRTEVIADDWTTCDILIHCTYWNWEHLRELERILQNEATWHALLSPDYVDEFNRVELEKRRGNSVQIILDEWEQSFEALRKKIEELPEEDWIRQSGNDYWRDGRRMTVASLFEYEYKGSGHEGGHAKEISEHFIKSTT